MPIVAINPDGTVDIARKSGRDRMTVKPEELGKYNPELIGQYNTYKKEMETLSPNKDKAFSSTEDVKSSINDLSTGGERNKARDALNFAQEVQTALKALDSAEQGGLPGASGPLTNLLQGVAGKVGIDTPEAALKDNLVNLVQTIRKERTGVQFSPEEQKELEELVGSGKIQEEPLRRKLNDWLARASNTVANTTGATAEDIDRVMGVDSAAPEKKKGGLLDFLTVGSGRRLAQDVGAGAGIGGETGDQLAQSQSQAVQQANKAFQKAQEIKDTDPEQAQRLMDVAKSTLQQVSGGSSELGKLFSQDIGQGNAERALNTASEITTVAGLPSMVSGGKKLISGAINKTKDVAKGEVGEFATKTATKPLSTIKNATKSTELQKIAREKIAQEAESKGVTIGNKTLKETAKEMLDKKLVTKKEEAVIKKLAEGVNIKPKEALDLMVRAGKKTFTKSGDLRMAKSADYYSLIRDGIRDEFSSKIPEVIKETSKIADTLGARKSLKTAAMTTGLAAGGIGGGAYLLSLFRGK